jgi:hypothetical protein
MALSYEPEETLATEKADAVDGCQGYLVRKVACHLFISLSRQGQPRNGASADESLQQRLPTPFLLPTGTTVTTYEPLFILMESPFIKFPLLWP